MKKGLTEIVFILDRSGSMSGLEKDTIGGTHIKSQANGGATEGPVWLGVPVPGGEYG